MQQTIEQLRTDQAALLEALGKAGCEVLAPNKIRCGFHDDQHPSAGVYESDGVWRFKCHGCDYNGDVFDVRARVEGKTVADMLRDFQRSTSTPVAQPSNRKHPVYPSVDAIKQSVSKVREVYQYTNPETRRPDMVVFRCREADGRKSFMQARPEGDGFVLQAPPKPWPIYNRARIATSDAVVVVEGEKCVHALHGVGVVATTNPGGAGKSQHADWTPLAGKTVYLWPDADPADASGKRTGIAHMREVAKVLDSLEPSPRVLWIDCDVLGLPPKGDAFDYIEQHEDQDDEGKRMAVEAVLQDAEPLGASSEVGALLADTISGKRSAVPWPWKVVAHGTKALLPGTVTILCGDPGATKSFWLLQAAAFWCETDVSCALCELEENRAFHLYRALAQRSGVSALLDDEWVREHPDESQYYFDKHADFLDRLGRCIHAPDDESFDINQLGDWVVKMAESGKRVIAVDPITAAATGDKQWKDDLKFLMRAKRAAVNFDCSIVLVTHPRKGRDGGALLDDVSGGAAFTRFSQTVMWLEAHEPPRDGRAIDPMLEHETSIHYNRTIHLCKTRNARGVGKAIAYQLNGGSVTFDELGIIVKDDDKE